MKKQNLVTLRIGQMVSSYPTPKWAFLARIIINGLYADSQNLVLWDFSREHPIELDKNTKQLF